jgi:hypothetical protein
MIADPEPRTCGHGQHWGDGRQPAGGPMPPAPLLKAGCATGMWAGVPVSWRSAWVGEPRDGLRRHGSHGAGLADLAPPRV